MAKRKPAKNTARTITPADIKRFQKTAAGSATWRPRLAVDPPAGPTLLTSSDAQRAAWKLLLPKLMDRALQKEWAERFAEDAAKVAAMHERAHAKAVRQSAAIQKVLDVQTSAAVDELKNAGAFLHPDRPASDLVSAPFYISGAPLTDSSIAAGGSWLKFWFRIEKRDAYKDAGGTFHYQWQNAIDRWRLVHIDAPLALHGDLYVGSGGGLLPGERSAKIEVKVRMDLRGWWQDPPAGWTVQADQEIEVLNIQVDTGGWFDDPKGATQTLYQVVSLRRFYTLVPPYGVVGIDLTATARTYTGFHSGVAQLDFSNGEFRVTSPGVAITPIS